MSQPSYCEARAEGYELAQEVFIQENGRLPDDAELDEMYKRLCERYGGE